MTDSTPTLTRPPLGLTLRSLLRADFTVLLRTRQSLLLNLAVPLVFVFATGFGQKQVLGGAGLLIGLSITYGLLSAGMLGYSVAIARDRDNGVFRRLRVTPTPAWAIMGSRIVVQLAASIVMSIIVLIVGSIVHHIALEWYQYLGMLGVSVLGALVFLALGQAIVGLIRSVTAINAVSRVLYIVLILAGVLGTTGILGDTIKAISMWTPVGALVNLYSAVLSGWSTDALYGLVASAGYVAVFTFLGIRYFRWDSR